MNNKIWWIQKSPFLLASAFFLSTLYFGLRAWVKGASFFMTGYKGETVWYLPSVFGKAETVSVIGVAIVSLIAIFSWLLSTRIAIYQSKRMRVVTFFLMALTIWGSVAVYGMSEAKKRMLPFFEARLSNVIFDRVNDEAVGMLEQLVFGQIQGFYLMITIIPVLILFFTTYFLINKYVEFDQSLNEAFFQFEWKGKWLQKLAKLEKKESWPDIELGPSTKNGEMVVLPGRDRTLNTMIIGSIGTGKTAALALPMIQSDLDHMVDYINDFPKIYHREDFLTEEVGGRYLNGLSIIEPSNDLCMKSLQLVKAHGIPDEAITYINPLDPNTPSINPMRGPVDKVAEVFAQVIAGLNDSKDGGNFFFEQAQRNHLKHYIYLLKLHDTEKEVTLDMLLDMYNNPQLVRSMHVMLKTTIPTEIDIIEDRDERNYWKIVQGIDEWFDLNLLPKMIRSGPMMINEYDEQGNQLYYDAKEEHVQGLRNILNDIGANPLIRRVLFGKSDFDFDRHMAIGGILLVNTAKGEMVQLARVLGKIVLMNLQNATFRRLPNVSPFHHILVDEAPDYLYNSFREFPAQSRKYKVIITTLQQTIAQLADQFGEHYMTTLIGTMRNRMVYGDVPGYDADYFSKMFGEKFVYEEGQSEMSVSPLQEDPVSRSGSSYSKVRDQAMSGGDIMFQDAFQCAVKIVVNNKPMPVVQINANFVPKRYFTQADVLANDEELDVWLESRRNFGLNIPSEVAKAIESIEDTEEGNKEFYNETTIALEKSPNKPAAKVINQADYLEPSMVDRAVNTTMDTQPRSQVRYRNVIPSATPIARDEPKDVPVSAPAESPIEQQATPTPEIIDVVLPKVSTPVESKQVEQTPEPAVQPVVEEVALTEEAKTIESTKGKLGSLFMTYEEAAPIDEPVNRQGYTASQLDEKKEQFFQDFQKQALKENR